MLSKDKPKKIFFIKDCFEKKIRKSITFFLHQDICLKERNHFYIKERTIIFLYFVDIFLSNFICDKFPKIVLKFTYITTIRDSWVDRNKEKDTCIRLKKI